MPENTPRTRRLWPAAALVLAVAAACVTVTAMDDQPPRTKATAPVTPPDNGPGLLSFASPSASPASTTAAPASTGDPASSPPSPPPSPTRAERTPAHSPTPSPGSPRPTEPRTSVRSLNYPDRYWQVSDGLVRLEPVTSAPARRAATFTRVEGLADARCSSFTTADGSYLRHRDFLLRAERADGSRLFRQDATFCPRRSASGAVMLESVNYPGRFLRHRNFQLRLDPYQNTGLYRADSAFLLVDGLA
ncbi:AbfB domain-containing protein [Streptomyces sp. Go40/10]|uniref:AbfB domain-containing protein n=1 Tax=Streptomyces sp. Go40/10 TaxID=2825844 RepID=UPI001E320CCE|nr:AbfB domain-containing protein [Streptomyces sp. Go40/10]UFR05188.1 AbfB domain-containing protein [Streptomyces sp. Go40/10]